MPKPPKKELIVHILDSLEMDLIMPESKEIWPVKTKKKTSKRKQNKNRKRSRYELERTSKRKK
jgi:hypothetical protein